jgi:hypothetical protein
MPIHDWSRADAGTYHDFHQVWTIEIRNALNRGLLPPGYSAFADLKVSGVEPDVAAIQVRPTPVGGGLAVVEAPPHAQQVMRAVTEAGTYARKANRIVIRHRRGQLVAAIEVVSPGNKESRNGIGAFVGKVVDFLRNGIHVVLIDPFPPGPRDPGGIHAIVWDEVAGLPVEPPPPDKPLTMVSYDASGDLTAYVNFVGVGDPLPDTPLFLATGWYINLPLERTYAAAWDETPQDTRDLVVPPAG